MAWGGPEEDDDDVTAVGSALADPAGTYANENGAAPEETPKIADGAPSTVKADANKADDEEANYIAGNSPASQGRTELSDAGLPDEREGISTPPDGGAVSGPSDDLDESGDRETSSLLGVTRNLKAPQPLVLQNYEDHTGDYQALQAQKAKENPANFQPSKGRRAIAGIAAALVGAGTRNAGEGMNVGHEITGAPLAAARDQWAAQEAPLQAKIDADKAADEQVTRQNANATNQYNAANQNLTTQARVEQWNALSQQRRAQAQAKLNAVDKNTLGPVDPNNPFGEWQGKTPNGQVVRGLEPPAAVQKSPAYIMHQRMQDLEQMQQLGIKLTDRQRAHYLAGDKTLGDATTRETISVHEKPDGTWDPGHSGNGRGPQNPDANVSAIVAKSIRDKDAFTNKYSRNADGSYVSIDNPAQGLAPEEFNAKVDKFRTDANAKLAKYGKAMDASGNIVDAPTAAGGQPEGAPSIQKPAPQQPAAKSAQQAPAPQPGGMVKVSGPGGVAFNIPPAMAKDGQKFADEKNRVWILQGGKLKPFNQGKQK